MQDKPFIDAHMHMWDLNRLDYPWLTPPFDSEGPNGSVESIASDYSLDIYRSELADWNLVGCVHVEAGANPKHALAETEWLDELASAASIPIALVAYADLTRFDLASQLAAHSVSPNVRGIRQIVNWHEDPARSYTPQDFTKDKIWQANLGLLADHCLSFDLQCYPKQMTSLADVFSRYPEVPVAINHLGMPVISDIGGLAEWREGMRLLAQLPQVCVKISGLGFIARDWDKALVKPIIEEVIALFGPDRAMLASDVPTDKLFAPIEQYRSTYASILDQFSAEDQCAILGGNANGFYRLGVDV